MATMNNPNRGETSKIDLFMKILAYDNPVTKWSLRQALVDRMLRDAYAK
jgi:hypothetical protein